MTNKSRRDQMTDLDSCNKELEEIIEKNEEQKQEETPKNKENTVQAKVAEEILRRGGKIVWGKNKPKT